MSSGIIVPSKAVEYILFQRTGYLVLTKNRLYRILSRPCPWLTLNIVVMLESVFRKEKAKQLFNKDMLNEYEDIKSWLPAKASTILDIGCGVGGIDVLLHRHYDCDQSTEFYLLDKTSTNKKIYYGFRGDGAFYNSLEVTELLLSQNGIPRENIHLLEVTPDYRIDIGTDVDLVISLISWGFHYPVSAYVDEVHNTLRQGGHLLIDVRKGTGGEKELEQRFAEVQTVSETRKKTRVLAVK